MWRPPHGWRAIRWERGIIPDNPYAVLIVWVDMNQPGCVGAVSCFGQLVWAYPIRHPIEVESIGMPWSEYVMKWIKQQVARTGRKADALSAEGQAWVDSHEALWEYLTCEETDGGGPTDPSRRVPEEELSPGHPGDPCCPGGRVAEKRDEATEEDDLAAVLRHEAFRRRQEAIRVATKRPPALEQAAAAPAADQPVAEVVAYDGGRGGHGDHHGDRVVALGGEHAEGDQSRLARQRNAEGLEHDDDEEHGQAVTREEVRQAA